MIKVSFFRVEKCTERGKENLYKVLCTDLGIIHVTGPLSKRKANEVASLFNLIGKAKALRIIDAVRMPVKEALDFARNARRV